MKASDRASYCHPGTSGRGRSWRFFVASASWIALTSCAVVSGGERESIDDPLEPVNRVVLDINTAVDGAIVKPTAEIYRQIVPLFVRDRLRAAIDNLAEPRIFVNDLLQRRSDTAGVPFARFFFNTTGGASGMVGLSAGPGVPRTTGG